MIKRLAGWVFLLPLSLALIVFALLNRHAVPVNINPFSATPTPEASGVPLFLIVYAVLLIGVLLGGIATWFAQGSHRARERHWRREAEILREELETARRASPAGRGNYAEVADLIDR